MLFRLVRYQSRTAPNVLLLRRGISYSFLNERGLIAQCSDAKALDSRMQRETLRVYLGIDPTAHSLHVGHLVPLIALLHFQCGGHYPLVVVGGSTGSVGDPSFRMDARGYMTSEVLVRNIDGISRQVQNIFDRGLALAKSNGLVDPTITPIQKLNILDNADWHEQLTMMNFLNHTGNVKINSMLSRDSMRSRMSSSEGLSFRELVYQLLQGYDFWHLHQSHGVSIQLGGQDQWGNIMTGLDVIRRNHLQSTNDAFALTTPLLMSKSGEKFGKSAGNAIWLDASQTSVFSFHQFWLHTADEDVEHYLRLFTFLSSVFIDDTIKKHTAQPDKSHAQRILANEMTKLIHGLDAINAVTAAERLFAYKTDSTFTDSDEALDALKGSAMLHQISSADVQASRSFASIAAEIDLAPSISAAKQLIESGGLYVNGVPVTRSRQKIEASDFLQGKIAVMRAGRNKIVVLHLVL